MSKDKIIIIHYVLYGLLRRTRAVYKEENISIQDFDLELTDTGYFITDEWWDLFFAFLPTSRLKLKRFIIKHKGIDSKLSQVKLKLNGDEEAMIRKIFIREEHIP